MKDNLAEQYLIPLKQGLESLEFRTQLAFAVNSRRLHKGSPHHEELLSTDQPGAIRKIAWWMRERQEIASMQFCYVNTLVDPGRSDPAFAVFSSLRTILDSAAILCWLTQLSIDSEERVRRSIIVRISDSVEELELFEVQGASEQILSERVELLNEIASVSHHFGLQIQRRQDGQVVSTTPGKPPTREIVESCLKMQSEYDQCSMIVRETLGHFRDQQFRKTDRLNAAASTTDWGAPISPEQLIFVGQTNARAITRILWSFGRYFDWECDLIAQWLEPLYDTMNISADHRFWRSP